uniref:Wzz/FepE/Etk N-terminal domain-containing protein n=1 Tax=Altererythrobacter segetis TaxID=1104773 RepID=UPI00140B95BA|nr:Wzz/FepE/Etk N-terminal domain-containing protein [Altererythrobacter segetis]
MNELTLGTEEAPQDNGGKFISYLPAILWQRRWWIIVPALVGVVGAVAAVLLIPPRYKANAVMLVESPQLPDEIIGDFSDSLIERRIAAIKQRVTSRPDLVDLINRHGLYSSERASEPLSDVIDEMRDKITLTPSTVALPSGGAKDSTVAFELSFEYAEAAPAQAVVQDLMDRILELDSSGNLEQATNTAQFLADQSHGLEEQIAKVQSELAAINSRYGSVLGSASTVITGNSGSYDVQIAGLQRDNANLIAQKQAAQNSDTRDPVVRNAEAALAAARAVYSENHPDVVIAKQRLQEARALARSTAEKLPFDSIDQQIAFNNSQIAQLRAAKAREDAQVSSQLAAQSRAPLVQQQISALQERLTGLNQQYQQVQQKLLSAKAGVRAEDEQMGERLTVVEPPVMPDEPVWPNRLLVLAGGVVGGLGLGLLLAGLVELALRPIRDPRVLTSITGAPPLGVVPLVPKKPLGARRTGFRFWRKTAAKGYS